MDNDIKVSVYCLAYNHEKYIRQCLEGFVMQKTDFKFEVLIHDDASTDKTADIIREYEKKYPEIIKPVYQTENQHSKKIPITKTFFVPKTRGKYVCFCEGDDCWIDPLKLQKQYDFLENNSEYSACVTRASFVNLYNGSERTYPVDEGDKDYNVEEIIKRGAGLFAWCTFMKRADNLMPEILGKSGFGDYPQYIYAASIGKFRCLDSITGIHYYGTDGSWTQRIYYNPQKFAEHSDKQISLLRLLDEYFDGKYAEAIDYKIRETEFYKYFRMGDRKNYTRKEYAEFYKSEKKGKFKRTLMAKFPGMFKLGRKIKGALK